MLEGCTRESAEAVNMIQVYIMHILKMSQWNQYFVVLIYADLKAKRLGTALDKSVKVWWPYL